MYIHIYDQTNPCANGNGGCEQFCFAYPNVNTRKCGCAKGQLASDLTTCERKLISLFATCKHN